MQYPRFCPTPLEIGKRPQSETALGLFLFWRSLTKGEAIMAKHKRGMEFKGVSKHEGKRHKKGRKKGHKKGKK
jgi:hypothetical protein